MTRYRTVALLFLLLCSCMPAKCTSIVEARLLPNTSPVTLTGKVVTYASADFFYIEEDNRVSAIRINKTAHGMKAGYRADIAGTMGTQEYRRVIEAQTVTKSGTGTIAPFGMTIPSVFNKLPFTSQLLTRIWGTPSYGDGNTFWMCDDRYQESIACVADPDIPVFPAARFAVVTGVPYTSNTMQYFHVTSFKPFPDEELVSCPGTVSGEKSPKVGKSYFYTGGTAICNKGHDVEYKFLWGDSTTAQWSDSKSAWHAWTNSLEKSVYIIARCKVSGVTEQSSRALVKPITNTEYWGQTNGPAGLYARTLARTSTGHIFAGTERLCRSIDGGQHWTYLPSLPSGVFVSALAINAQNYIFVGASGGVYRSTDDGDHWTLFTQGLPESMSCYDIVAAPSGALYAGFQQYGVYRSTDSGEHWTRMSNGIPDGISGYSFAVTPGGTVYAGTAGNGVFRSADNGASWTAVNTGLNDKQIFSMVVTPDGSILAGTRAGAYKSANSGASWSRISSIYSCRVLDMSVSSTGSIFAAGDYFIYRSTDNGNNWSVLSTTNSYQAFNSVLALTGDTVLTNTSGNTMLRSTDNGASWTELTDGMPGTRTDAIMVGTSGRLLAGGYGIVYTSDDQGATWIRRTSGLSGMPVYAFTQNSARTIFAGTFGDRVYRSTDNGVSWSYSGTGMTDGRVLALATNSKDQLFAGTLLGGVFKSIDGGNTWAASKSGLPDSSIRCLAVGPGDVLYAGTADKGLFRSSDDGATWTAVGAGVVNTDVRAILAKPNGNVFAVTTREIYRSTDNGISWISVNNGIGSTDILSAITVDAGGRVIVGGFSSAYVTSNNGDSWSNVSAGVGSSWITGFCINSTGRIFASTYDDGVIRSNF